MSKETPVHRYIRVELGSEMIRKEVYKKNSDGRRFFECWERVAFGFDDVVVLKLPDESVLE